MEINQDIQRLFNVVEAKLETNAIQTLVNNMAERNLGITQDLYNDNSIQHIKENYATFAGGFTSKRKSQNF